MRARILVVLAGTAAYVALLVGSVLLARSDAWTSALAESAGGLAWRVVLLPLPTFAAPSTADFGFVLVLVAALDAVLCGLLLALGARWRRGQRFALAWIGTMVATALGWVVGVVALNLLAAPGQLVPGVLGGAVGAGSAWSVWAGAVVALVVALVGGRGDAARPGRRSPWPAVAGVVVLLSLALAGDLLAYLLGRNAGSPSGRGFTRVALRQLVDPVDPGIVGVGGLDGRWWTGVLGLLVAALLLAFAGALVVRRGSALAHWFTGWLCVVLAMAVGTMLSASALTGWSLRTELVLFSERGLSWGLFFGWIPAGAMALVAALLRGRPEPGDTADVVAADRRA